MPVLHDGPIEVARLASLRADEDGGAVRLPLASRAPQMAATLAVSWPPSSPACGAAVGRQLPSAIPEDQAPVHDYLAIGVKFEDGHDAADLGL